MAAVISLVGQLDTNAGAHTTPAGTTVTGDLIVVLCFNTAASPSNSAVSTLTESVGGGTYTKVQESGTGTSPMRSIWIRNSLIASGASTTWTETPVGTTTGGGLRVYRVTGMSRAGLSAAKQSGNNASTSGTAPFVTFAGPVTTTNPVLALVNNLISPAGLTPPTGWTEDQDTGYSVPTTGAEWAHRDSGETNTTVTWAAVTGSIWQTIGVELDASSAGTLFTQSLTATLSFIGSFAKSFIPGGGGTLFTQSFTATLFSAGTGFPTTNLVSYWKLDEASGTRFDSVGSNHLTDNNTVGSATGIITNGASFVAANSEHLSCASNSSLQMSGNTSFTISAWVKLGRDVDPDQQLVTKDDDAANSRDFTLDYKAGHGLRFYIQGGGTYIVDPGTPGSVGVWYFIVAWYDSSNGQLHTRVNDTTTYDSATGATGTDVSNAQFRIGAREYAGFEGYADAVIDEVGLWKRKLTAGEITTLYNGGAGLTYSAGVPAATLSVKALKAFAAIFSPIAALTKNLKMGSLTRGLGSISLGFSGAFTRKVIDAGFSGTVSFIGNLARSKTFIRALTATLSFTGTTLSRRIGKALAATLSFIGNLVTALISGGEVFFQNLTATLSFSGALAASKSFLKAFAATLSFTAALTRRSAKAFAAMLNRSATLVKRIADAGFSATLSFVGAIAKNIRDAGFTATLSFAGFVAASKSFLKTFAASLSFSGTVATFVAHFFTRAFTATLSFSGTLSRRIAKTFSATRSFAGNLATTFISGAQQFTQAFTATLNTAGALAKRIPRAFAASLSFAGNLTTAAVHFFTKSLTATLSFTGNLVRIRLLVRAFTATLSFAGTIWRKTGKVFSATTGFSTAFRKAIRKRLAAVLSFVAAIFKGGATTILAGQVTGGAPSIAIAGSTANIIETGAAPRIGVTSSSIKIAVTGSQLRIEKTK